MRLRLTIVFVASLLVVASCSTSTTQPPANSSQPVAKSPSPSSNSTGPTTQPSTLQAPAEAAVVKPRLDACALLTSKEIELVQGEPIREIKLTGQSTGGFSVSQCFFTLPTFTNSVSLQVTQKGEGPGAADPKQFWRNTFHRENTKEKDMDHNKKRGEEEGEKGTPPQKIPGIGDDAYWTGSRVGGALYVLKKDVFFRISVGGAGDEKAKLKKSKTLAQQALKRI